MSEPIVLFRGNELEHHGILGMKWGIRNEETRERYARGRRAKPTAFEKAQAKAESKGRETIMATTKNGSQIALVEQHTPVKGTVDFKIYGPDGKRVGDATLDMTKPGTLDLSWVQIKSRAQGQGYALAVANAGIEFGKRVGVDKITALIGGQNYGKALPLYEKMGFKFVGEDTSGWGGYNVEMDLTNLKHSDVSNEDFKLFIQLLVHYINELEQSEEFLEQANSIVLYRGDSYKGGTYL